MSDNPQGNDAELKITVSLDKASAEKAQAELSKLELAAQKRLEQQKAAATQKAADNQTRLEIAALNARTKAEANATKRQTTRRSVEIQAERKAMKLIDLEKARVYGEQAKELGLIKQATRLKAERIKQAAQNERSEKARVAAEERRSARALERAELNRILTEEALSEQRSRQERKVRIDARRAVIFSRAVPDRDKLSPQQLTKALLRVDNPIDILRAAGLDEEKIEVVTRELRKAGSSAKGMVEALRRADIPDEEAEALALALRDSVNTSKALRAETQEPYARLRRVSEQGVRLSEVGFTVGAAGAAAIAPFIAATTRYAERYKGLTDAANEFTRVQYAQQTAMDKFGQVAAQSVIPVLHTISDLLKAIADFAQANPGLIDLAVKGGIGLAVAGTFAVVAGRLQSVIARLLLLALPNAPGSLTGTLSGVAGNVRLGGLESGLGKAALKLAVGVTAVAGTVNLLGGAIDTLAQRTDAVGAAFQKIQSRMDVTGDGFVNFDDVLAALRVGIYTVVDGFFRVATAIATFGDGLGKVLEDIGRLIRDTFERTRNGLAGKGFVSDTSLKEGELLTTYQTLTQRRVEAFEKTKSGFDRDAYIAASMAQGKSLLQASFEAKEIGEKYTADARAEFEQLSIAVEEARKELEAFRAANTPQDIGRGLSPTAQKIEDERVRVLAGLAEFVRSGDIGSIGRAPSRETDVVKKQAAEALFNPDAVNAFIEMRKGEIQAEREYQKSLVDARRSFRLDDLRNEREYQRSLAEARLAFQRSERDALEKYEFDREKDRRDFARKEAEIERERARERQRRLRELYDRLLEFAAARDVAGFVEEQKRFRREQAEEARQAAYEKAQRKRDFDIQADEARRQFEFDRALAARQFQEKLADMARAHEVEKQERQRQFDEQLAQMKTEYERQKVERQRAFAEQLAELASNEAGLNDIRNRFYQQQVADYATFIKANQDVLRAALAAAYGTQAASPTGGGARQPVGGGARNIPIRGQYIPSFDTGGYVSQDMVALVHRGERVLSPTETARWSPMIDGRGGRGGGVTVYVTGNAIGDLVSSSDLNSLGEEIAQAIARGA